MASANDDISVELPAPRNWKKFVRRKGGTSKRKMIIFTSPKGEEITSRSQLEKYLKSHPGGPVISEFNWGTSETVRRSVRLTEKLKTAATPESEPPKKRARKSALKETDKEETSEETETTKEADLEEIDQSLKDKGSEAVEVHGEGEENQDEHEDEMPVDGKIKAVMTDESEKHGNIFDSEQGASKVAEGCEKEIQVEKKDELLIFKDTSVEINQDELDIEVFVGVKAGATTAEKPEKKDELLISEDASMEINQDEHDNEMLVDGNAGAATAEEPEKHENAIDVQQGVFKDSQSDKECANTKQKNSGEEKDGCADEVVKLDIMGDPHNHEFEGVPTDEPIGTFLNESTESRLMNSEVSKKVECEKSENGSHGLVNDPNA